MLCGAQGSRGAVGAAGVCAPTLAGWRGGMCAWGWAWGDVPQSSAFSSRQLEGLPQAPEDIRVVLGRREVAGVDSLEVARIGQHGFRCGLWYPPPHRLEATILHRPLAGPVDQALEGGLCPGLLLQLPELRVGPALQPLSMGGEWPWAEEWAWVDVVGSWGQMAVAGPGESPYSCAVGVRGERGRARMWTRGYACTVSASGLGWDSRWRR